MKYITLFENFSLDDILRSNIIDKADKIAKTIPDREINCETFCNHIIPGFKSLNILFYEKIDKNRYIKGDIESKLKIGDVISFGHDMPRHYAIYIGNGKVIESEGWGSMPEQKSVIHNLEEYYGIIKIFRDENILNNFRF